MWKGRGEVWIVQMRSCYSMLLLVSMTWWKSGESRVTSRCVVGRRCVVVVEWSGGDVAVPRRVAHTASRSSGTVCQLCTARP